MEVARINKCIAHVVKKISVECYFHGSGYFVWQLSRSPYVMKPYATNQKAKVLQFFFATKSVVSTQRKFKRFFKTRNAPSRNVILNIVHKGLEKGSVENLNTRCGAKRTKRTPAAAAKAQEIMMADPKKKHEQARARTGVQQGNSPTNREN